MALEVVIPKQDREPIDWLVQLDEPGGRALVQALRSAEPTLSIGRFAEHLAATLDIEARLARQVVRALSNMYRLRFETEATVQEVVDAISAAIERESKKPASLDAFRALVSEVIGLEGTLGVLARGRDLMADHERSVSTMRILTDLRPVFRANADEDLAASVLVHTLRIEYFPRPYTGEKHAFYVAMDGKDLRKLRTMVDRAIAKEGTLRRVLGSTILCLPESEEE